jgi:GTP cyclohydrolase I
MSNSPPSHFNSTLTLSPPPFNSSMVKFSDTVEMADKQELNGSDGTATPESTTLANGTTKRVGDEEESKKKRKKEKKSKDHKPSKKRKNSLSKAARDPRDALETPIEETSTRSPSPVIDFDGLSRPSKFTPNLGGMWSATDFLITGVGTRARLEESPEQAEQRLQKLSGAVRTILECLGEDPDREGLLDTPGRYAKAMLFFTRGYQENVKDIINNAIFKEGHNELVIVKDIEVFSLCEHHMVPFTGKVCPCLYPHQPLPRYSHKISKFLQILTPHQMHIGYIPDQDVIGISKLPRIADMFSRRLQIQERLTKDVANAIMEVLKPQGVAVVMESSHLCMVMRGVEKTSATTITSCVLGCIEKREKTRNEFFSLVGLNRRT